MRVSKFLIYIIIIIITLLCLVLLGVCFDHSVLRIFRIVTLLTIVFHDGHSHSFLRVSRNWTAFTGLRLSNINFKRFISNLIPIVMPRARLVRSRILAISIEDYMTVRIVVVKCRGRFVHEREYCQNIGNLHKDLNLYSMEMSGT